MATTRPPRKLWVDTDPGFDDLLTLLLLHADASVEILGISVVAGNAPLPVTLANACRIKRLFGLSAPVYAGAEGPLCGQAVSATSILGDAAMGSVGQQLPDLQAPHDTTPAHLALIDCVRRHPGEVTVVAIGPHTNLARAIATEPDFAGMVRRIVFMGGSTDRGNHTAAAEFNIFADPEAADRVCHSGAALTMFGLNLCRQVLLTGEHVAQLRGVATGRAQLLADHLQYYLQIRHPQGLEPMPMYDPVVAAWLAHPELFSLQPAHVEIELAGQHTRGMTVCEFRVPRRGEPNADVAMHARGEEVMAWLMSKLCAVAAQDSALEGQPSWNI